MALGFFLAVFVDSFFEWTLHRYVMHRKLGKFDYPFKKHALVHHRIFKADETYHLSRAEDQKTVPMAWWNGPVLVALCQVPFLAPAFFMGNGALLCGSLLAGCLYYGAYEYIHWCMHIPRHRQVERSGLYFRLNGHHLLHHRYMSTNFNVVLPLADLCCGTLLVRSKVHFAQARDRSLPDVQPRADKALGIDYSSRGNYPSPALRSNRLPS